MVIRRTRRRSSIRRSYASAAPVRRRPSLLKKLFSAAGKTDFKLEVESRVARDIWAVIYLTLGILTYLSLGGQIGTFGEWWTASFRGLFGIGINFIPLIFFAVGGVMLGSKTIQFNFTRVFGIMLLTATALGIVHLSVAPEMMLTEAPEYGGLIGFVMTVFFRAAFADMGAKIILFALFLIGILLTFGVSFRDIFEFILRLSGFEKSNPKAKLPENDELKVRDFQKEAAASLPKKAEHSEKVEPKKDSTAEPEFRINRPGAVNWLRNSNRKNPRFPMPNGRRPASIYSTKLPSRLRLTKGFCGKKPKRFAKSSLSLELR
ncbi:MAG: DNA translocase FtsK 4TM domain-containing protein [Patescibacteria group bacterium]